MTNYQKVLDFNKVFGVKMCETTPAIFEDTKLVNLRMDLIREEMKELEEAVANKDMVETIDALADILYVVYGMGCSFGVDMDKAVDLVHKSNMSKVCATEKEAIETVANYKETFVKGEHPYENVAYRVSDDGKYYVVYNVSNGKILKSINYHMVDLREFVSQKN